jgi:hypothetical protein
MSCSGKIPRTHAAYDQIAGIQHVFHHIFIQREFRAFQAQPGCTFRPEAPAGSLFRIISVVICKIRHIPGCHVRILRKIQICHLQTQRAAACEANHVIPIAVIAPAPVPLHQQRHLPAGKIFCQIDRLTFINLPVGIILHIVRCLPVLFQKLIQYFRQFSGIRIIQSPNPENITCISCASLCLCCAVPGHGPRHIPEQPQYPHTQRKPGRTQEETHCRLSSAPPGLSSLLLLTATPFLSRTDCLAAPPISVIAPHLPNALSSRTFSVSGFAPCFPFSLLLPASAVPDSALYPVTSLLLTPAPRLRALLLPTAQPAALNPAHSCPSCLFHYKDRRSATFYHFIEKILRFLK